LIPRFEPTVQAAHARLAAVQPYDYARTRNHLDGAVTGLSPYLTHGLLSLREAYDTVHARQPLDAKHKLVFELGWRAYYRHVWAHRGGGIHQSFHPGLLPDDAYQAEMPADVLEARTGVAAIDRAVSELYATGYLHNHARMWLASYLVHLRKVHWHTAAQWMLGYLLDGDMASNHLSWQWVAGTGSSKPYLFNADNVAKYAPSPWHSPGTVLDTSYEALDLLARKATAVNHRIDARGAHAGVPQPALTATPPGTNWSAPDRTIVTGRDVWLLHPWSLGTVPHAMGDDVLLLGVGFVEGHMQTPWSERRWNFVAEGLRCRTPQLWWGNVAQVAQALQGARSLGWQTEAHADSALNSLQTQLQAGQGPAQPLVSRYAQPPLFDPVEPYCESFAKWWRQTAIAQ
jgi:deoxyribodipyrimidine photo-lyase